MRSATRECDTHQSDYCGPPHVRSPELFRQHETYPSTTTLRRVPKHVDIDTHPATALGQLREWTTVMQEQDYDCTAASIVLETLTMNSH
jgi:hypothetical protein